MKEKLQRLLTAFDLKKFVKFGLIGVLNTLVDFLVSFLMDKAIGQGPTLLWMGTAVAVGPYISNTVAYVVANIHSFLWNKFWTFQKKERVTRRELGRALVTSCGYLLVSNLSVAFFMNLCHLPFMFAKVPTAFVTILYNYFMNKFWVFR